MDNEYEFELSQEDLNREYDFARQLGATIKIDLGEGPPDERVLLKTTWSDGGCQIFIFEQREKLFDELSPDLLIGYLWCSDSEVQSALEFYIHLKKSYPLTFETRKAFDRVRSKNRWW